MTAFAFPIRKRCAARPRRARWLGLILAACAAAACGPGPSQSTGSQAAPTPAPTPSAPTHTVTGKIALEGSDRHSGALVFLGGTSLSCLTDSQGAYTIANVPPGKYELLAEKSGYQDDLVAQVELPDSGEPQVFRLAPKTLKPKAPASAPAPALESAAPRPTSLSGRVALKGAADHAGVLARVLETGDAVETDPVGEFYFANITPGACRLEFVKTGYERIETAVNVKAGAANRTDPILLSPRLDALPNRILTGQVFLSDPDGAPQADFDLVSVSIDSLDKTATLAPDGSFRFEGLPAAKVVVTGAAKGYRLEAPAPADLEMVDTAKVALRFVAEAEKSQKALGAVVGRVIRRGVEGSQSGIAVALAGAQFATLTAPDGAFRFDQVPEGVYLLYAEADGFEPVQLEGVEVAAAKTTDLGELVLERSVEPPRVVKTQPRDGETKVRVVERLPVVIQFSKPMQAESLKAAFQVKPVTDYQIFAGREHPQSDDRRLYVELLGASPGQYVEFDTSYKITVAKSAVDSDGIPMAEDFSFTFRTAGPSVVGSNPADGEKGVVLDPTRGVVFYLNDQLKTRSLNERLISVRPALEAQPRLETFSDPYSGWTRIIVYGPWKQDSLYTVTLGSGIENVDGKKFDNTPYAITFRTAAWRPIIPYDSGRGRIRPSKTR